MVARVQNNGLARITSLLMADDPMIRIVILYPATASEAAKLERVGLSD